MGSSDFRDPFLHLAQRRRALPCEGAFRGPRISQPTCRKQPHFRYSPRPTVLRCPLSRQQDSLFIGNPRGSDQYLF